MALSPPFSESVYPRLVACFTLWNVCEPLKCDGNAVCTHVCCCCCVRFVTLLFCFERGAGRLKQALADSLEGRKSTLAPNSTLPALALTSHLLGQLQAAVH